MRLDLLERNKYFLKLFLPCEKRENATKTVAFGADLIGNSPHWVRINLIFIHPQDAGQRGNNFEWQKKLQYLLLFCVNAKNKKSGPVAFGAGHQES